MEGDSGKVLESFKFVFVGSEILMIRQSSDPCPAGNLGLFSNILRVALLCSRLAWAIVY